jgi:hypothetical protein
MSTVGMLQGTATREPLGTSGEPLGANGLSLGANGLSLGANGLSLGGRYGTFRRSAAGSLFGEGR